MQYKPLMTGLSFVGSAHWQLALPVSSEAWLAAVLVAVDQHEAAVSRLDAVQQSVERLPVPILLGELSVVVLGLYPATRQPQYMLS